MGQDLSSAAGKLHCGQVGQQVADAQYELHVVKGAVDPLPDDVETTASSDEEDCSQNSSTSASTASSTGQCVIIFDWDDTLLCSTALKTNRGEAGLEQLAELEEAAAKALAAAQRLGEVLVVTNGNAGWVMESARRALPGLVPTLEKLRCISARHMYESQYPGDPRMWKKAAFQKLITEDFADAEARMHLIALGDQMPEIEAARFVGKLMGAQCRVKTVKLRERPSVAELVGQLRRIEQELPRVVGHESSASWSLMRPGFPRCRNAEQGSAQASTWRLSLESSGRGVAAARARMAKVGMSKVSARLSLKEVLPVLA